MQTVREVKKYLEVFDDDVPVIFTIIHPDDEKYIARSIDNKVSVILEHPTFDLRALASGFGSTGKGKSTATVFLTK